MLPGIREKKGRDMGQKRKKINGKELVLDISYDIVGSVLYALGIYTFAKTADFAPGGLSGLAPVSYTHLDVYKRQSLSLPQKKGVYGRSDPSGGTDQYR